MPQELEIRPLEEVASDIKALNDNWKLSLDVLEDLLTARSMCWNMMDNGQDVTPLRVEAGWEGKHGKVLDRLHELMVEETPRSNSHRLCMMLDMNAKAEATCLMYEIADLWEEWVDDHKKDKNGEVAAQLDLISIELGEALERHGVFLEEESQIISDDRGMDMTMNDLHNYAYVMQRFNRAKKLDKTKLNNEETVSLRTLFSIYNNYRRAKEIGSSSHWGNWIEQDNGVAPTRH